MLVASNKQASERARDEGQNTDIQALSHVRDTTNQAMGSMSSILPAVSPTPESVPELSTRPHGIEETIFS